MVRTLRVALAAAVVLTLQACGRRPPQAEAADAAQHLLAAAWSGDARSFEAGLDRPAIRADLRRQLAQVAQANTLSVEGGASDAALDRMISPAAFRLADDKGAALADAPAQAQLVPLTAPLGKDRACVHALSDPNACLLIFAREAAGWRLVGMAPPGFTLAIPPAPAKPG